MKFINQKSRNAILVGLSTVSMFALAGCGATPTQAPPPQTVASVNMQLVMENSPQMAQAQEKMKVEYDKIRNEMKDNDGLSAEQKQQKVMEAQKKLQDLEKTTFAPIQNSVNANIDEVMKTNGISTVVDKRVIIRGGRDITKDVLVKEGIDTAKAQQLIDDNSNAPE